MSSGLGIYTGGTLFFDEVNPSGWAIYTLYRCLFPFFRVQVPLKAPLNSKEGPLFIPGFLLGLVFPKPQTLNPVSPLGLVDHGDAEI